VVERTLGWLHRFRRLRIRYERRADIHQGFLSLVCAIICLRFVERFCSTFLLTTAGFEESEHSYRPRGLPIKPQPWLASLWRKY